MKQCISKVIQGGISRLMKQCTDIDIQSIHDLMKQCTSKVIQGGNSRLTKQCTSDLIVDV